MKTIITTLVLVFVQITMYAQEHDHLHELLENKSLRHFEIEMGFTENDSILLAHARYIDSCYQEFFGEVMLEVQNNPSFEETQARSLFELHALQTLNGLADDKPAPGGGGGGPKALNGPCENMDFETGDFFGWELTRGDVDGSVPYSYINEVVVAPSAYHQIFAGGVDPVVGIPRVNPDGGGFSARLGNGTGTGARAARLRQSFLVDATNFMYKYSYAVVFESPDGHALNEQPYFTVRVFDSTGASISCGEYSVIADAASAPDYESIVVGGETVLYKDWTTVFTNLNAYIGQNVTIEFTSGDCSLTGHYGYAYVDAFCGIDSLYTMTDTICTGDSTLITAPDGLGAYLWSTGETTQSIWAYNGGHYTCELTPVQGPLCGIILDIDIYEFPTPVADFTFPANVCLNQASSFTDLSAIAPPGTIATWQWDFGDGIVTPASSGAIVAVPNTSGTYTAPNHTYAADGVYDVKLIVTSADGCQDSITYQTTVLALPVVGAGPDQAVCDGVAVTLNGSGAVGYAWDNGVTNGVPFVQAVGTITYTVTGTDANGCQNTDQVDVTVWPLPNVGAGPDQAVCDGVAVTLNGSGALGYAWDNGVTNGLPFVQAVGTVTYTVTGTDGNGCQNTDQVDVTVWPLPNVGAGTDQAVCDGVAVTLNGSGAVGYAWDNGVTNGVPFVQAVGTITYTVTGTDGNGCQNTDQVDVTVWPLPNVGAGPDQAVCLGTPVTLNGSGAMAYDWNFGVVNGVPFNQGLGTVTYTVTGTDGNGCQNTDQVDVTVWNLPNVWAGADQAVCDGVAVTLNGSGALGYAWDNGVTNGVPFVQAVGTVTYTVTGTDGNGCQNTDQVDVTVWPLPNVGAGADQAVCDGVAVTLNGSGAVGYAWDNGVTNGVPFVQAVGTITYTVTGTDGNGCQNTDQVDVTVWPLPNIGAGPDQAVCDGVAVTLNGSGALGYAWDNGVTNGVPFVQAVGTITYTVTGTDGNGCQNTDQVDVTVWPLPNVGAGADQAVCDGVAVTLNGSGAVGYAWDNGVTNGVPFVQAVGTVTYTVTGTDGNGCQNTDQVDVTVWPLPNVGAGPDQAVCDGVAVTLNGSGAVGYAWDNGVTNGVPFVQAVGTITYTVTGTDGNGCQNTDQVDVTVWPLPIVGAGLDQVVCEGAAVTLNGSGADAYAWNMGVVDGVPFVQGIGVVSYTVVGTDANGCQNTDQTDVTVGAYPNPNAGPDQIVCENTVLTLTSPGGPQLSWSNGVVNGVPFVQPLGIQVYVVYDTTALGCSASDTVRIEVLPNPVVTSIGAEVCPGQEVTLSGQGAVSYSWTGGILNGVPFTPTQSGAYIVTGIAANGCTAKDTVWVEVYARPEASFYFTNNDLSTLDSGTGFVNTSIGGSIFQWNFGDGSPYSYEFEPYHEFPFDEGDSYTVTLVITTPEGCVDEFTRAVSIEQDYNIFVPNTFTPDNNGVNEIFKPILDGFDEEGYTLLIFNRWGQLIFESHDMSVGWDGTYANRFDSVQDGVFTWKVVARVKKSAQRKEYVGHVSILK